MGDDLGEEWWTHETNFGDSGAEEATDEITQPTDETATATKNHSEKRKRATDKDAKPKKKKKKDLVWKND